jgi:hypothetical protein
MPNRVSREAIILLLIASVSVTGCVKQIRSTVPAFAQAVELTTTNVQAAFDTVNDKYADAQTIHFAVTYNGQVNPSSISTDWLQPGSMKVREQLLDGLKQYASKLSSLTGTNDVASLNQASTAVGTSLKALANAPEFKTFASTLPADISDQATTAVNALGNSLIELKLKKDLPAIIENMDPTIQEICSMLSADIGTLSGDPAKPEGSGLRLVLWDQYNQIIVSQNEYILHNECNKEEAPINCFSPDARFAEIEKLPTLVKQQNAADMTLVQVQVTVKQLAQAHAELVKAAQTKQNLTADLGDLLAEAQRLNAYYTSLSDAK